MKYKGVVDMNKKGFTLVEIIVVLVILAILAAIAIIVMGLRPLSLVLKLFH